MQLRYKKFWNSSFSNEEIELGDFINIYKTDFISPTKHTKEHKFGESFDYIIVTSYSDDLYDKLYEEGFPMYKINNKLLFIIEFSYIDESEYKINDIDKFPIEVLKNCFIVRYPSDRGVKHLPLEERQKLLDSIEYTSIAKVVGLYLTGFKLNEIVLYNPITLKPLRHLQLERGIPFEKVQDTYKSYIPDYVDIFTDEDLTDIYHKHLQEIYEEAY